MKDYIIYMHVTNRKLSYARMYNWESLIDQNDYWVPTYLMELYIMKNGIK